MRTRQSAGGESGCHNFARKHFAKRSNVIVGARSDFPDRANAAQQFVQIFEVGAQVAVEFGEQGGAKQFSSGVIVAFAQGARHFESGLAIAAAGSLSHGEQGIGDLRHCTDHHYRPVRQPALDDMSYALNRFRILYGSPAELHHNHGRWYSSVLAGNPPLVSRRDAARRVSGSGDEVSPFPTVKSVAGFPITLDTPSP